MPTFDYTARDNSGAAIAGSLIGESIADVSRLLRIEGKYPTSVQPAGTPAARAVRTERGIRISRTSVIQLAMQLSIMVDTGVTLSEALNCISIQADEPQLKLLL